MFIHPSAVQLFVSPDSISTNFYIPSCYHLKLDTLSLFICIGTTGYCLLSRLTKEGLQCSTLWENPWGITKASLTSLTEHGFALLKNKLDCHRRKNLSSGPTFRYFSNSAVFFLFLITWIVLVLYITNCPYITMYVYSVWDRSKETTCADTTFANSSTLLLVQSRWQIENST